MWHTLVIDGYGIGIGGGYGNGIGIGGGYGNGYGDGDGNGYGDGDGNGGKKPQTPECLVTYLAWVQLLNTGDVCGTP